MACVGAMLTSLSPGLTMTNKPGALKHGSPSPVARLGRLLSRVAVLGAVPATIAVATLNREPQIEAAPDTAPNRMLGEAATYSNMEPMESASSTSADSSALESRSSDSGSDALAAPLSSTVAHRASVSMGQQVAMAKQVMEELKGCVWHGLEVSKRGDAVTPAVFHVLMSPGVTSAALQLLQLVVRDTCSSHCLEVLAHIKRSLLNGLQVLPFSTS